MAKVELNEPMCAGGYNDGVRLRAGLQTCSEIDGLPDDGVLKRAAPQHLATRDDQSTRNANPDGKRCAQRRGQPLDGVDDAKAGPHGSLGRVLAGPRIAEVARTPSPRKRSVKPSRRAISPAQTSW